MWGKFNEEEHMSIFGSIVSAIFGTAKAATEAVTGVTGLAKPTLVARITIGSNRS